MSKLTLFVYLLVILIFLCGCQYRIQQVDGACIAIKPAEPLKVIYSDRTCIDRNDYKLLDAYILRLERCLGVASSLK